MVKSLTWQFWPSFFVLKLITSCVPMFENHKLDLDDWRLRYFILVKPLSSRLSLRTPMHYISEGVFVFNINLETLLWALRDSSETFVESYPALYLTRSPFVFSINLEILLWVSRGSGDSHRELPCIVPHRESLCLLLEPWHSSVSIKRQ